MKTPTRCIALCTLRAYGKVVIQLSVLALRQCWLRDDSRSTWKALYLHVQLLLSYKPDARDGFLDRARIQLKLSEYEISCRRYRYAKEMAEEAPQTCMQYLGAEIEDTAACLQLGCCYMGLEDSQEAEEAFRKGLHWSNEVFDEKHDCPLAFLIRLRHRAISEMEVWRRGELSMASA